MIYLVVTFHFLNISVLIEVDYHIEKDYFAALFDSNLEKVCQYFLVVAFWK